MAKSYSSGLIGLDIKTRRRTRLRRNQFNRKATAWQWVVPLLVVAGMVGVLIVLVSLR